MIVSEAMQTHGAFTLTEQQLETLSEISANNRTQPDSGMAIWEIKFSSGKHSSFLTHDAYDRRTAFIAAIERFGRKVSDVY